jgi:hypothetical protein
VLPRLADALETIPDEPIVKERRRVSLRLVDEIMSSAGA